MKVGKLARTRNLMYLLTLDVKEIDDDVIMVDADSYAAASKTIRAMVYDSPKDGFLLLEWKFKR